MHQHLVDDDLKEQRGDEREDLEEKRGNHHLAEHVTVFMNGAKEPGDVESAREVRQRRPPRHQDEPAIPNGLELGPRHQRGPRRQRGLNEHLVLAHLGEEEKPTVLENRDPRQRGLVEPLTARSAYARLEAELPGDPKHLGDANRRFPDLMPDLFRTRTDAMEPQHRNQRGQAGVLPSLFAIPSVHVVKRSQST